jgi:hypothetical protein
MPAATNPRLLVVGAAAALLLVGLLALLWRRVLRHERFELAAPLPTRVVCPTRNQSYDIRGDPAPPPAIPALVWNAPDDASADPRCYAQSAAAHAAALG